MNESFNDDPKPIGYSGTLKSREDQVSQTSSSIR